MKFATIVLASVVAATAAIDQPMVESPVVWEVEAFKDGPTLKLEGTIQEVHKQLVEINHNYDTDFNLGAASDKAARDLSKRTDFSHSHTICGNFPGTTVDHLGQGISYLRGVGGRPSMGGRGTCGRVSCSYNTAIWWCNDDAGVKTLASFGSIADGAQWVWNKCAGRLDKGLAQGQVSGQAFHPTNWNVIVRKDKC
ncbi:hypothetical protein VHEMI04425 [[Torrubiella] hemipterigena]|uniref:Secreted protein n=1 Tax=[Torrubiella] hemipterigena TaxID=1531966 RepID=A0A0A1T171_9HYPO|nr:hypothetical protein VHEMI04425 [[Torrubiella] hemipterigena]